MSAVTLSALLFLCPIGGTVDQLEGSSVAVVLGHGGVRVISRSALRGLVHEGDRIDGAAAGGCRAVPAPPWLRWRVSQRLRSLARRRAP